MRNTIYKYTVPVDDETHAFDLPRPAEIIRVASQYGDPDFVYFWAVVDPGVLDRRRRYFRVVGTGHIWPAGAWHIGSAEVSQGRIVWHLLELNS